MDVMAALRENLRVFRAAGDAGGAADSIETGDATGSMAGGGTGQDFSARDWVGAGMAGSGGFGAGAGDEGAGAAGFGVGTGGTGFDVRAVDADGAAAAGAMARGAASGGAVSGDAVSGDAYSGHGAVYTLGRPVKAGMWDGELVPPEEVQFPDAMGNGAVVPESPDLVGELVRRLEWDGRRQPQEI